MQPMAQRSDLSGGEVSTVQVRAVSRVKVHAVSGSRVYATQKEGFRSLTKLTQRSLS